MDKKLNLIWIDLEMTGLIPNEDRIIEVATLITDPELNIIAEGPSIAVKQSDELMDGMDDWNQKHHSITGLIDRVKNSSFDEQIAEQQTIEFLQQNPALEEFFHYRNLDVSSVKELVRRWKPEILEGFVKNGTHIAMDDIKDSIAELIYYREHFIDV